MPEHKALAEPEAETASQYQYLQNWTKQLLPFIQRAAKRSRLEDGSYGTGAAPAPSNTLGEEQDDVAARLLLSLATSTGEPSTSNSVRDLSMSLDSELTAKGKKRIGKGETRVRPPPSVTKFLSGPWSSIRMPNAHVAMEAEDMVVLYVNARYPNKLGNDKLAANEQKLLNYRLSHHDMPAFKRQVAKLISIFDEPTHKEKSDLQGKEGSEIEVLSSFIKSSLRGRGAVPRRMPNDVSLKSNSTNIPFADLASISSIKLNGLVKSGSMVVGDKRSLTSTEGASLSLPQPTTHFGSQHGDNPLQKGQTGTSKERSRVTSLAFSDQDEFSFRPSSMSDMRLRRENVPDKIDATSLLWPKLRNATTVVDRNSMESFSADQARGAVKGGSDGPRRAQAAESLLGDMMKGVNSKVPRGRQARFDEIVDWCVRVKRAAGQERPLTVDNVVALANVAWAPVTLNASTLRKRIKRTLGISWAQVGTAADPEAGPETRETAC